VKKVEEERRIDVRVATATPTATDGPRRASAPRTDRDGLEVASDTDSNVKNDTLLPM
jgi:hypothetical protein